MNTVFVEIDAFGKELGKIAVDAVEFSADGRSSRCWVCNSENSRLVPSRGYGIVHECVDCGDRFPEDGAIQWPM